MRHFMIALAFVGVTTTTAIAQDSYQAGEAWGTGTSDGYYMRELGHATGAANAVRRKNGDNITSTFNQIYSIGTQTNMSITGDNNVANGNTLKGENRDSTVTNSGQINGGNAGDFNPFTKTKN